MEALMIYLYGSLCYDGFCGYMFICRIDMSPRETHARLDFWECSMFMHLDLCMIVMHYEELSGFLS